MDQFSKWDYKMDREVTPIILNFCAQLAVHNFSLSGQDLRSLDLHILSLDIATS